MAGAVIVEEQRPAPARGRWGVRAERAAARQISAGSRSRSVSVSVRRNALLDRLARERVRPLILLTAPAGYGKTALLAQWARESDRPCAWVSLDDPARARAIPAALIRDALSTIGVEPGRDRSFGLILDNAQRLPPEALRDAVLGVLSWLPDDAQLAVASRTEPSLALSRMRAQRLLVEIGSDDLAMSADEAALLLRRAGLDPELATVQSLVLRAEGWPAALELSGGRWAQRSGGAHTVPRVSGDDHVISEYFRAEILAPLTPATLCFLRRSSVLDRVSGALCDQVLGRDRSADLLAELARTNVPLHPVDSRHEWYRLHGLFREMLQTELRRSEPNVARALHRRATAWYRGAGDVERALDHAGLAEDHDATGELLWAHLAEYLGAGRSRSIEARLRGVPADRVAGCASLALAAAHGSLASGRVAVAEQWARSAAVQITRRPDHLTGDERAGAMIIHAWAARSGARAMGAAAAAAYDLLADDSPWRATCCWLRGTAALLTDDGPDAERWLDEGAVRGAVVAPDAASLCLAQLAVVAGERDRADDAADLAHRACRMVAERGLGDAPASALVFAVCATVDMREGRFDEAKTTSTRSRRLLEPLDESLAWFCAETRILLARVSLALGDVAGTRGLLAEASRLARRTADVVVFQRWFDDAWGRFDERAESALSGTASLTTAELRVLRFLPTHYSFQEIAQRLHVSSNTVKTHVHAVYRKLNASSRSEAVAHASRAGLLGC